MFLRSWWLKTKIRVGFRSALLMCLWLSWPACCLLGCLQSTMVSTGWFTEQCLAVVKGVFFFTSRLINVEPIIMVDHDQDWLIMSKNGWKWSKWTQWSDHQRKMPRMMAISSPYQLVPHGSQHLAMTPWALRCLATAGAVPCSHATLGCGTSTSNNDSRKNVKYKMMIEI